MATNRTLSLQVALGLDTKEFEKTLAQLRQKYESFAKGLPPVTSVQGNPAQISEQVSLFEKLEQSANKAGSSLAAIAFRFNNIVFAAQALASGVSGAINTVIGQVAKLEQQVIGIQSTLAATNRVFQGGIEVTEPLAKINALRQGTLSAIADIRQKSLELAGVTSDQLIDLFSVVSTNIGQIGGTLQDATKLVGSFAAGLGTLGIPLQQARQEINSILLGTIDQNSQLAKQLGINNQIIAQEKQKGTLVDFLVKKLGTLEAGQALVAKTFSGVTSNIAEIFQRAQEAFGQKLLDPLVVQLNELYKILSANQKGFETFAAIAASVVLDVATKVGAIAANFAPLLPILSQVAAGFGGALATGLQAALSVVQAFLSPIGALLNAIASLTKDGFGQFLLQATGVAIALNTLLIPAATNLAVVLTTNLLQGLSLAASALKSLSLTAAEAGLTGLVGVVASLGGVVLSLIPGVNAATAAIVGLQLAAGGIVLVLGALVAGFAAYSAIQAITKENTDRAIAAQERFVSSSNVLTQQLAVFNKLRKDGANLTEEQVQAEKNLLSEASRQISINSTRIEQLEKQKTQWFQNTQEIDKQIASLKSINAELANTTIASQVLPRIGTAYEQITQKLDAANKAIAAGTGTADQLEQYAKTVVANVKTLLDAGTITAEQAREQLSVIANNDKLQFDTQISAQKAITESFKVELDRRIEDQKAATDQISLAVQTGKIDAIAGEKELTKATLEEIRLRREARLKDEEQQRGKAAQDQKATLDELVRQEAEAQAKIEQIRARGTQTQRDLDIKAKEFRIEALQGSAKVAETLAAQEEKALEDKIFEANVAKNGQLADSLIADLEYLKTSNTAKQKAAEQEIANERQKLDTIRASKATSNADEIASTEKDLKIIGDKKLQAETAFAKTTAEINRNSRNKQAEEDRQITEAQLKERQNLIAKQTEILQQKNRVAADALRKDEQKSQEEIIQLRLNGFKSETDLQQKSLDANKARLTQQIEDQQQYINSLKELYAANPALTIEEANQRRNTLAEEELKLGDLILKQGEQQLQQIQLIAQAKVDDLNQQKAALDRIIKLQTSLNDVVKAGLELDKSRVENIGAEADVRIKGLQAVAQLREQTLTAEQKQAEEQAKAANASAIADEKRRLLREQLKGLGLSELATAKDIAAAERQQEEISANAKARQFEISQKIAAFEKEAQIQALVNSQKQLEIETQILAVKAKASGDQKLIAEAQQQVALTKEQGEALKANIEIQRQQFQENQASQLKVFNQQQELDDYASKQKAADAGIFGLKTSFAKAKEEAAKLPDTMAKATDAATKLNKGIDGSTESAKKLQDATSGVGKELDAATQKADALATAAQSAASALAAAAQSRAAQDKVLQDAVNDPALRQKILEGADPADLIPGKAKGGTVLPNLYRVNEQGQEAYTNYSTGRTTLLPPGERIVAFPSDGYVHNATDTKRIFGRANGGEVEAMGEVLRKAIYNLRDKITFKGSGLSTTRSNQEYFASQYIYQTLDGVISTAKQGRSAASEYLKKREIPSLERASYGVTILDVDAAIRLMANFVNGLPEGRATGGEVEKANAGVVSLVGGLLKGNLPNNVAIANTQMTADSVVAALLSDPATARLSDFTGVVGDVAYQATYIKNKLDQKVNQSPFGTEGVAATVTADGNAPAINKPVIVAPRAMGGEVSATVKGANFRTASEPVSAVSPAMQNIVTNSSTTRIDNSQVVEELRSLKPLLKSSSRKPAPVVNIYKSQDTGADVTRALLALM